MLNYLLSCVIDNLQPEGKYLLVRLYQRSVDDEKIPVSFRALASRYRLSVAHVSDALAVLVSSRVLVSTDVKGGPGRSKKRYAFDVEFLERISATELPLSICEVHKHSDSVRSSASTQHLPDIARLLVHEDRELEGVVAGEREDARDLLAAVRARRRIGGVSVVNRLLLAVMLLHADRFGVVRDIGSVALQKMTCLSSGRLKHRIARLIEIGVIKAYVPGAARSALFNKTSSVYFLNLDHPELSAGTSFKKVRIYKEKVGASGVDLRVADQILSDAIRFRDAPGSVAVNPLRFNCIAELFQAEPPSMYPLLQLRLESYAAHLLSKYGDRIYLLVGHVEFQAHVDAELKARIRADFSHSKALASIDRATAVFTSNALRNSLEDELYERARDLALSIHFVFDGKPDSPMDLMDFTIVPQAEALGAYEVELLAISRSI